ncbi:amino acid adenylation domain-containing protein [Nitrospira sp. M1]
MKETLEIAKGLATLSSEKRKVFQKALREKGLDWRMLPIVPQRKTSEFLPLSPAQQRLWFLEQLDPGRPFYHLFSRLRFRGQLDLRILARSFEEIVHRHEVLRTAFVSVEGEGKQVVEEIRLPSFDVTDLSSCSTSLQEMRLHEIEKVEMSTPFDLARPPLFRVRIVQCGHDDHTVMFTVHHIVFDAWSVGLLLEELREVYTAFAQNRTVSLPDLPVQYTDVAIWQHDWIESEEFKIQQKYWETHLADFPPVFSLPVDCVRPVQQGGRGKIEILVLSEAMTQQLYALCHQHNVTLYMLMLAVFNILLHRYSGYDDISVGTSIANRSRPEIERLVGFFVNTLVLRNDLSGDPPFLEFLERVKQVTSAAYTNQDIPFENLLQYTGGNRQGTHASLFRVFFVLENLSDHSGWSLPGVELETCEESIYTARFDLSLRIRESKERQTIQCGFEYDADLFEYSTIIRLLGHYRSLLEAVVTQPASRLSGFSLLPGSEREQIVGRWNDTHRPLLQEGSVHQLFEDAVCHHSESMAVVYEDKALTYREVEARANQLAHYLQTLGVGPDVRVGLCLERSLDLIVGLLAVLKAGGAYVPLVPTLPQERLQYLLRDSRAHIVLTQTQWSAVFADTGLSCVCLDREWPEILALSEQPVDSAVRPDNLAYVIYTSGSTGQPKGVGVEHRQLVNYLHGLWVRVPLSVDASSAMLSTVAADLGHTAIFGALCSGRPLHVLSTERGFDPNAMAEYMQTHAIDVLKVTPSHLLGLLEATQPEQVLPRQCLILGGEAVPPSLLERIRALNPSCTIINHYGPTETTVGVLTHPVTTDDDKRARVPIGRPLANTQAYILDHTFEPTPIGIPGELYIGGQGVARGYLERPALTAARFLPDPFSQQRGGRLYRTGDRARYLADGTIEFLGRVDNQVKVRGFRIELGEIEAQLRGEAGVTDAVVVVREHATGGSQLVAYVVGAPGAKIDVQEVRQQLAQRLPDYMVPSAILRLDAFPLTPNGKVDRTALPDSDASDEEATTYAGPSNSAEATLVKIWTEVLRREPIGIHDNFFELGGDSILTLQVIARAHRQGLKLTPKQLFEWPTVAQLAAAVPSSDEQIVVPPNGIPADSDSITPAMLPLVTLTPDQIALIVQAVPGGARNVQDIYPLAPLQEGLFFHHLLSPDNDPYVLSTLLGFDTRERMDGFLSALKAVIARHDILRTAIWWEGLTEPVQVVWREAPVLVEETHLGADEAVLAEQLCGDEGPRHYRFDIRQAPLLRVWSARNASNGQWQLQLFWHHLIGDHVTMALLTEEIQMIQQGEQDRLQPPVPFRNFVATARQGRDVAGEEAFFTKMLGDVVVPTAPFGLQSLQGDAWELEAVQQSVAVRLAQRVRQCARRLGVSAASLLHLAWAQVLARITGQADVVFGTVLLGRMHASGGVERMPGLFMNTLPVRVSVDEQSVAQSVRKTHECVTQLLQHEHASLALAQRCSGVDAQVPLFTTLLNYRHNQPRARTDKSLVDHEIQGEGEGLDVLGGTARTHYAVSLDVDDDGKSLTLTAQVAIPGQAHRLCEYMQTGLGNLVEALESAPETPVKLIDVVPDGERAQLLTDWNATEQVWGEKAQNVVEVFEAQVTQTPEAVAVVCGEECVTYAELNAQANQVAQNLNAFGVDLEVLVGICMERSVEMIVALLGVWKAGGVYLPLDLSYPQARLALILDDAQPAVVLTQLAVHHMLPPCQAQVLCIDNSSVFSTEIYTENARFPVRSYRESLQMAYMIYTSGSTGRPKGVMISHRSALNFLAAMEGQFQLTRKDRLLAVTSLSFDISLLELFLPLRVGGQVVLADTETAHDGLRLLDMLNQGGVTMMQATPATWRMLLDVGWKGQSGLKVLCGGESLSTKLVEELVMREVRLWNLYGPTETTVWSTMTSVTEPGERISIGRPIANTQTYVLDASFQPVPIGVSGELYIGGVGLARGYWHRSELTAERFVPNPFSPQGGERLYRTGDVARYRPDGMLECLGRVDHQVKLRGYRIELGEIEAQLRQQEGIHEVVVVARDGHMGGKELIGYVVPAADVPFDLQAMKDALTMRLPEYMVPRQWVELDTLPLTPNGKVDRQALPDPDRTYQITQQYMAPRTPTEELLAGIWADLLKVERIGIHDNFFDLGGHSLLATQVMARLRTVCGVEVPLRTLFEFPTVAALDEAVETAQQEASGAIGLPLRPIPREGPMPLSFAQERLWVLWQLAPDDPSYNIPVALRLTGTLNITALEQSFQELARRHEVLRTTMPLMNGEPRQVIAPGQTLSFSIMDLRQLSDAEREEEAQRLAITEASSGFNLSEGQLVRVTLLQLRAEEHVLLLTLHHSISDGWSTHLLVRELTTIYAAYCDGQPSPLPELSLQYADYAQWQRQWLTGDVLARQMAYWEDRLGGRLPVLALPTDHPRPMLQSSRGAVVTADIPITLSEQLKSLSRREGTTLFMTLLTGFYLVLARYTGQTDLIVGTPIANRTREEIENLIGFFVNTLAMRIEVTGIETVRELLTRVRDACLGAYAHQDVPFEQVVETLQPVRTLSHSPIFQVMFDLQNAPEVELEIPGLEITALEVEQTTAKFDLSLSLRDTEQGLVSTLEYNTDLFEASTMTRLLVHYEQVLHAMMADPEQRVALVPLLTHKEMEQLLTAWNATEQVWDEKTQNVVELFEAQVVRTPDAVAVVCEDQPVTYAELNNRANVVAYALKAKGVGPETLVGICLERSVAMVVGVLGVWKAGGGYVPLDPSYPQARLAYILHDAHPAVVLTQPSLGQVLPQADAQMVYLDQDGVCVSDEVGEHMSQSLGLEHHAGHTAYVIYTSGSTGQPKGVMISQANALNFLAAMREQLEPTASDRLLAVTSLSFDISLLELLLPLIVGARVILADTAMTHDGLQLRDKIHASQVTMMQATPSTWQMLIDAGWDGTVGLRTLCGGEALTAELASDLIKRSGPVWNLYGPTETTVWSTMTSVTEPGEGISIGQPIANTQTYVLDASFQPVPIGVSGELYIGGVGLARGYWHRPELTAERFVPNPFSSRGGERLYRTGDVARYRPDGMLECLGRVDHQVKLRGYRIELGEIEAHLLREPSVREAVVVIQEEGPGGPRLVAYYSVHEGKVGPTSAVWRQWCQERLPVYMVPSVFVELTALPRTPNGKVDRQALLVPDVSGDVAGQYVAPRTPTEELLAGIWADLLKVERVGIHDNFFDLGGHSLLAVRMVSCLRDEGNVKLDIKDIFMAATVSELSVVIESAEKTLTKSDAEWMTELLDALE